VPERIHWNHRELDAYLGRVESGTSPRAGGEELDEATRAFEAVALGLRRVDGLERARFEAEFGDDPIERFAGAVREGRAHGLLEVDEASLRLSRRGRLLASEALLAFLPTPKANALPA
jgi:coproporphyrinogen III oxidase-like Fe-S oxidoreductase